MLLALCGAQLAIAASASAGPCLVGTAPGIGPSSGGSDIRVNGDSFTDATSVRFGGVEAQGFTALDPSTIVAVTPPHEPGLVDVVVTTPDGPSVSCDPDHPEWDDFRFVEGVAGTWSKAGFSLVGRVDHTATRLVDGRVLIAGGSGDDDFGGLSELYDPVTRVWRATGSLNFPRTGSTATLLPDGRVLVAGGTGVTGFDPMTGEPIIGRMDSSELYNPATETWTVTANAMATARSQHTATLLANGKVLVTGGVGPGSFVPIASSELFDPATGLWSSCSPPATPTPSCPGPLNDARRVHTAAALKDGRVIVTSGKGNNPSGSPVQISLATTELYDPATGTWSRCTDANASATCPGPLAIARFGAVSVTLGDGKVLVIAGQAFDGTRIGSVEEYDPASGHWGPTGFLGGPRTTHAATLLANGKVLVSGGIGPDAQGTVQAHAEVYDPATRRWTFTAEQIVPRRAHSTTLLANGQVLAVGGRDVNGQVVRRSELFTLAPVPAPIIGLPPAADSGVPAGATPAVTTLSVFVGCPSTTDNAIVGTAGADTITATSRADRILAGDGGDTVHALAGDDCLDLAGGDDRGVAGAGDDLLVGGTGADRLTGDNGDDRLRGDAGRDTLTGGRGDDELLGGSGNDILSGGRGEDTLRGNSGSDRITGGLGTDTIAAGDGADTVLARDGQRDTVICGAGRDVVTADRIDRVARSCERVRRR